MHYKEVIYLFLVIVVPFAQSKDGHGIQLCYECRSRGDLGTCRDPFTFNGTETEFARGVAAVPCASGWCGKMLEGGDSFNDDDYGTATQRMCLQRGPSDKEERCASTLWNHKKVFMCFCKGYLCNSSGTIRVTNLLCLSGIITVFIRKYFNI